AFLPFSIEDLSASELGVEDAFGGSGRHIAEELAECCCGRIRLRAVERFLTQALRDAGSGGRSAHSVAAAISRMLAGRRGISSLAREQGWSVRQLERRFLREVGLPPRLLARIFRFQRVLRATAAAPGRDWVSIALECGYADQPHLIREFREFAGETPVSFSRAEPGLARAFISPERLERFFA
ncbi:MAG TPA: helix-turn-helix domain-containing protein, partial [Thermoanaerobaculia bacterium]